MRHAVCLLYIMRRRTAKPGPPILLLETTQPATATFCSRPKILSKVISKRPFVYAIWCAQRCCVFTRGQAAIGLGQRRSHLQPLPHAAQGDTRISKITCLLMDTTAGSQHRRTCCASSSFRWYCQDATEAARASSRINLIQTFVVAKGFGETRHET